MITHSDVFFCFTVVFDVYRDSQVTRYWMFFLINQKKNNTHFVSCIYCMCLRVCRRGGCGSSTWTHSERWLTRCCSPGASWRLERLQSSRSVIVYCMSRIATHSGVLMNAQCVCGPVQEGPAFRYTTSEVTVQPSPCLSYRIPRDFVDLSTGEDAYKLIDFLKLVGPGKLRSCMTTCLSCMNTNVVCHSGVETKDIVSAFSAAAAAEKTQLLAPACSPGSLKFDHWLTTIVLAAGTFREHPISNHWTCWAHLVLTPLLWS